MGDSEVSMSDKEREFVQQCQQLSDLCDPLTPSTFNVNEYLDGTLEGIRKMWKNLDHRVKSVLYVARKATVQSGEAGLTVIDDETAQNEDAKRREALRVAAERELTQEDVRQAANSVRSLGNQVAILAEQILQ